jgi:hypothetical protein
MQAAVNIWLHFSALYEILKHSLARTHVSGSAEKGALVGFWTCSLIFLHAYAKP